MARSSPETLKRFLLLAASVGVIVAGFYLAVVRWQNAVGLVAAAAAVVLGVWGVQYYSGFYHRWLVPDSISALLPTHNTGLEAMARQVLQLLETATKDIRVLSGNLRHEFYELDEVVAAFRGCLAAGVEVKIIVGRDPDPETVRIPALLDDAERGELRLYYFPEPKPVPRPHFMVVDSRHFRIEEFHDPATKVDGIQANRPSFYDPQEAEKLVHAFDDMWRVSSVPPAGEGGS